MACGLLGFWVGHLYGQTTVILKASHHMFLVLLLSLACGRFGLLVSRGVLCVLDMSRSRAVMSSSRGEAIGRTGLRDGEHLIMFSFSNDC